MAENLADEYDLENSDDDGQVPATHNKLLGAISQLYEKKRVKAPTRKEPSLEVSEFHLSQPDKKQGRVKVTELAKVLNKRAAHAEIGHKLKVARKRARTLPRPLEKFHADQITRAAGYEHAKRQLNRWDAIVYQHKVADQLQFPLKSETVKIHQETTDVSKLFRKPTELEIKLAEMLKEPDPTKPQKEDVDKAENNEEEYPLTLAEVIEKRKMMAKLRAQQSYKQSKAARHSKIKSKKFHQIQRRARVKEQLKEFEELQKKDPEAALRKLEELERTRAEERVTLRHRSTGQWAKNLSVRAKYDKEARIALSEQLAKSRELTVKLAQDKDSESEREEEGDEKELETAAREEDPNNPWVLKPSKEMEEFISGYRKFWENKEKQEQQKTAVDDPDKETGSTGELSVNSNKEVSQDKNKEKQEQQKTAVDDSVKETRSSGDLNVNSNKEVSPAKKSGKSSDSMSECENEIEVTEEKGNILDDSKVKTTLSKNDSARKTPLARNGSSENVSVMCFSENKSNRNSLDGAENVGLSLLKRKSISRNVFNISNSNLNKENISDNSPEKCTNSTLNSLNISIGHNIGELKVSSSVERKTNKRNINSSFTISTTPVIKSKKGANSTGGEKTPEPSSRTGVWSVTKVKKCSEGTKLPDKLNDEKLTSCSTGKFVVSPSPNEDKINQTDQVVKVKSIDELFEEVEDKLQDKIREKCERLKQSLAGKRKNEVDSGVESDAEELPSLELKKQKITADVDEELLESRDDVGSKTDKNIEKTLLAATSEEVKSTDDIDPNKFLKVTPRHLVTKLPDIATEGDDALDDEETAAEQRHLTISEAFAEDDVVDQFQKEKDEEVKKSSVGDVDLTLPGWGSWGGHNIKPTNRRKRKKFVIKFPKVLPRRDTNRGNVIINEDADKPIKEHQVSDVPYPFTSVKEYEASIRAPLGATWVPQTAHVKLTAPTLVTRLGAVIAPMDDSQLVNKDKSSVLPSNKAKRKKKGIMVNKHT